MFCSASGSGVVVFCLGFSAAEEDDFWLGKLFSWVWGGNSKMVSELALTLICKNCLQTVHVLLFISNSQISQSLVWGKSWFQYHVLFFVMKFRVSVSPDIIMVWTLDLDSYLLSKECMLIKPWYWWDME